jgi:O-antigen ligase
MGFICLLSILVDLPYLIDGYRLSGLLLHDTGMSLYAAVALGLNLCSRLDRWRLGWIVSACLVIALSASRIGLMGAVLILGVAALYKRGRRRRILKTAIFLAALVLIASLLPGPSLRLIQPHKIDNGVHYRLSLYGWSFKHIEPWLFGLGASQTYTVLFPKAHESVPGDIQETLNKGYPIWYTHNQFLDFYIQYGLVGLVLLLVLLIGTITKLISRRHNPKVLPLWILTVGVTAHLMVNTPSIELMPLVFIALFAPWLLSIERRRQAA